MEKKRYFTRKKLLKLVIFVALFLVTLGGASLATNKKAHAEDTINKNFLVYYRAWRDKEMSGVNTSLTDPNWITMDDIPYGVNIVNVFSYVPPGQEEKAKPFFDKLKSEYAPNLHKRGIKLIRGFDYGKLSDFTYTGDFPTDQQIKDHALAIKQELMDEWGLDGLDIDMETRPSEKKIAISNAVIRELAKYIGPKSGNKDTLFLYDTNGENLDPFKEVADCFDILAYQQYGSSSDRTERFVNAYSQVPFAKNQMLPGLTFPEEQDLNNKWIDTNNEHYEQSNIYNVANYVRENQLGGMFLYAFDRDGKNYTTDLNKISPSNLAWTKTAILEVNGWSLTHVEKLAEHHLDRIKYAKGLSKDEVATIKQKIKDATNLYDANLPILGESYDTAISPTYDPVLEDQLSKIDLTELLNNIDAAKARLAQVKDTDLENAVNVATMLISLKEYDADSVNTVNDAIKVFLDQDFTQLDKLITQAESLKETDYTKESFEAVTNFLTKAKAVRKKIDVRQTVIDKTVDELRTAINNLVKQGGSSGGGSGNNGGGSGNNGGGTVTPPVTPEKPGPETEPGAITKLNTTGVINYIPGYNVFLRDSNGKIQSQMLKDGTNWKVNASKLIDGKLFYRLGNDNQWIEAKYLVLDGKVTKVNKIGKVVYHGRGGVLLRTQNGTIPERRQYLMNNSNWKVLAIKNISGKFYYLLGNNNQWIPAEYMTIR